MRDAPPSPKVAISCCTTHARMASAAQPRARKTANAATSSCSSESALPATSRVHDGDETATEQVASQSTKRQRIEHLIQRGTRMAGEQERKQREHHPQDGRTVDAATAYNACISTRRTSWTAVEDAKLRDLVHQHGRSDWSAVASQLPGRDRKRCRERFVNHLEPTLESRAWSVEEETKLLDLQRALGCQWAQLAKKLVGRSPKDVKNRWLALANRTRADRAEYGSKRIRRPPQQWTTAEKAKLRSLVVSHGARNWLFIASQLPGRTDLQCLQHWHRVLDDAVVKGKGSWTTSEDCVLRAKVAELGTKWTEVAKSLPGRIGKQCRERFVNHVDPKLNKMPWSAEEEKILTHAHAEHSTHWSVIATELPGRSESAIKNHWRKLQRQQVLAEQDHANAAKP